MRRSRSAARLLGAAAALALAAGSAAAQAIAEPPGYRMEDYRSPVPATLQGARVVDTEQAAALWREGAVFIDVMPQPPRPARLPAGTVWREPTRDDIPGSLWLPDVGYGALAPDMERYFRENLEKATNGDPNKPLVFYCLADCWMSWNAARRALEFGYRNVVWYPEGVDGWSFADLPLERRAPEPRPSQQAR